jgi:hypothetical protein
MELIHVYTTPYHSVLTKTSAYNSKYRPLAEHFYAVMIATEIKDMVPALLQSSGSKNQARSVTETQPSYTKLTISQAH